jgi:uncharacterized protein (DUF488 family)
MITRQRILLSLIEQGRVPKRTQLMKWLFLLRHEAPETVGESFYEFVPHKYGPFSFQVYREISALESAGFLKADELVIPAKRRREARAEVRKLPTRTATGIDRILRKYGKRSLDKLLDDVYERYPWYASRSERRPRKRTKRAPLAVYTVGYEGRTVDGLLDHLLRSGIRRLVDVRKNAMSRKYGFTGKTIAKLCADVGIEYTHVPALGIPGTLRVDLDSPEAYQRLFDLYEREILPDATKGISQVADLCLDKPSALMCFEASSQMCHRGRLAPHVAEVSHLEVRHI